jgi:hypothetical protein
VKLSLLASQLLSSGTVRSLADKNVAMEIYFDESGNFRPSPASEVGLCAVMGVIVPENEAASLQEHFSTMIAELPREVFIDGEPKGYRLSAKQGHCGPLTRSAPSIIVRNIIPIMTRCEWSSTRSEHQTVEKNWSLSKSYSCGSCE